MFPDGGVFRRGCPQRRRVNNTPQRRPLFRRVGGKKKKKKRALTLTRPHRTARTVITPETYLDWPGRAAKGFLLNYLQ